MTYYGFLATHVPPQRLLTTAALKAYRAARNRLVVRPYAPARDELLDTFGCAGPQELARRLAIRPPMALARDRGGVPEALERFFPGERERAVARAEAAARGEVLVFGRRTGVARTGGGTDWQRDPVRGGHYAAWAPSEALPPAPGCDIKNPWAVGRGDQWVALACGAVAEPREASRFAAAFVAGVRDFAAQNPVGRGVQWACPMEAGLRMLNVAQAHVLLRGARALEDPGYALDLARLAVATGRYIADRLEDSTAVPNNHLAADWLGLLVCGLFLPEWPEAERWREAAVVGLRRELRAQTHDDGLSFEGSATYHRLALELFTAAGLLCRASHLALGAGYWRRLGAMFRALRGLLCENGELPQLGDNDSGRIFAFHERGGLEGGYLLPIGAALLRDPALRLKDGAAFSEEVLWLFGPAALKGLAAAPAGPPAGSVTFPQGGFHLLRRGRLEAAVSCGPNGQRGVGGHSHNDKLAFELRHAGELLICDPGSLSYTADPEVRNAFRSTRAHATLTLDGAEQNPLPPGRLFALPDEAQARSLGLDSNGRFERFSGEHRGYARLGVVHRRELLLGEELLLLVDELEGDGWHRVEARFPLPHREARVRTPTPAERERLARLGHPAPEALEKALAVEIGPEGAARALLVLDRQESFTLSLAPSTYSPGYGEAVEACTVVWAGQLACPGRLRAAVLPL
ncbi:alginate lyase family protein [Anaeromyxobacter paludicola]|uniref:Heparin-sulfate lyase N-terminal domain-containing protein n=1 Tax=Anaeromyxobacter paludicola TaxID=2918171 RepID=A0ABN6N259_9BACT|nr:alginate lyase family protein [Anaeromyxobacter paludicola]BDG07146.1 hypothetical protein AMPC_02590 [Anaeromyxobacter paludicola]